MPWAPPCCRHRAGVHGHLPGDGWPFPIGAGCFRPECVALPTPSMSYDDDLTRVQRDSFPSPYSSALRVSLYSRSCECTSLSVYGRRSSMVMLQYSIQRIPEGAQSDINEDRVGEPGVGWGVLARYVFSSILLSYISH